MHRCRCNCSKERAILVQDAQENDWAVALSLVWQCSAVQCSAVSRPLLSPLALLPARMARPWLESAVLEARKFANTRVAFARPPSTAKTWQSWQSWRQDAVCRYYCASVWNADIEQAPSRPWRPFVRLVSAPPSLRPHLHHPAILAARGCLVLMNRLHCRYHETNRHTFQSKLALLFSSSPRGKGCLTIQHASPTEPLLAPAPRSPSPCAADIRDQSLTLSCQPHLDISLSP